jgi:hypothetical protein
VSNEGGYSILIYQPEAFGYSSPSADHPRSTLPYADFTYSFTDGSHQSSISTLSIDVIHINHEPINDPIAPLRLCSPETEYDLCGIQLPLTASDPDDDDTITNTTVTSPSYYRIIHWPLLGDLYQVSEDADLAIIEPITVSLWGLGQITTNAISSFAWASKVMSVSSPRYIKKCNPSLGTCNSASNILGAYDWYPKWSIGASTWSPSSSLSLEYIELDFGQLMYVTSIEIYETWITGSVIKLSVANDWYGSEYTSWTTLWQSVDGPSIPGCAARVFAPSLCACLEAVRYLRVDIDTRYGRPSIDAIKMIGTERRQVGQLKRNGVIYVPPMGIEPSILDNGNMNSVLDTFSYKTSDCLIETHEATIVEVLPSLQPVTANWGAYWMLVEPEVPYHYILPLQGIHSFLQQVATKSPNSIATLLGIQVLNLTSNEDNWLYSTATNETVHVNDWLPFTPTDSTMVTADDSISSLTVNIPSTLLPPSFLLGIHVQMVESSVDTLHPRTYTWMLRLRVVNIFHFFRVPPHF